MNQLCLAPVSQAAPEPPSTRRKPSSLEKSISALSSEPVTVRHPTFLLHFTSNFTSVIFCETPNVTTFLFIFTVLDNDEDIKQLNKEINELNESNNEMEADKAVPTHGPLAFPYYK